MGERARPQQGLAVLVTRAAVRGVASEIANAAKHVIEDYKSEQVVEEPQITDRLLGAISERLRRRTINGVIWSAKTLRTSRGVASEEQRHGADFLGVLDIKVPDFTVTNGFVAQAKRAEPGQRFSPSDWKRLQEQCEKMLQVSPDSFVVAYSQTRGVCFVPALEIVGSRVRDLFQHYSRSIQAFFELFIECFIGDARLCAANVRVLDQMRRELPILELTARTENDD